ncbi:unnamed protein product [Urochloa humidicola]
MQKVLLLVLSVLACIARVGGPGEPVRTPCDAPFLAGQVSGYCTSSSPKPLPVCCHYIDTIFNGTHGISCAKVVADQPELKFIMYPEALLLKLYLSCRVNAAVTSTRAPDFISTDGWATCPWPLPCPQVKPCPPPQECPSCPEIKPCAPPQEAEEFQPPQQQWGQQQQPASVPPPPQSTHLESLNFNLGELYKVGEHVLALCGILLSLYLFGSEVKARIQRRRSPPSAAAPPPSAASPTSSGTPPTCELTPCRSSERLLPARELGSEELPSDIVEH